MTKVIEVINLKKQYGQVEAVKGISFTVKKGTLFAFLGTNGAGKSTTIEMLCTFLDKSSGDVLINGYPLGTVEGNHKIRQSIGIVFQQNLLDPLLTVKENIVHRGKFYQLSKEQLTENYDFVYRQLQLEDIEDKRYGKLSGGQKRRADIARAIIHKPTLLFLDEPTTGLDPHTRKFVWETIERLRQETNMTVFLTTHYMEEATFADQVVVIKKGEIVAEGTPNELKEQFASDQLIITIRSDNTIEEIRKRVNYDIIAAGDVYKIKLSSTMDAISILQSISPYLSSFEVVKGSLDQVFIQINEEM